MLTLTAAASNLLQQQNAPVKFKVELGAPVSKDITHLVRTIPTIRESFKLGSRAPEPARISVVCDNENKEFSEWDTSSILYNKIWHNADLKISIGVEFGDGTEELVQVASVPLVDVVVTSESLKVELIGGDSLARLKRDNVDRDLQGDVWTQVAPALIVRSLLSSAGVAYDSASFTVAITTENLSGLRVDFTVGEATWFAEITRALDYANAAIRWKETSIEYFYFRPALQVSSYPLDSKTNLISCKPSRPDDVVNSLKVIRSNNAGPNPPDGETANSPIEDLASISNYGRHSKSIDFPIATDTEAENMASERIFFKSQPKRRLSQTVLLPTIVLQPGDPVATTDEKLGLVALASTVFSRAIDSGRQQVALESGDIGAAWEPWLYIDNSQTLDSGQVFW